VHLRPKMETDGYLDHIPHQRIKDYFKYNALRNALDKSEIPFDTTQWLDFNIDIGIKQLRGYRILK
jgi:hypothetical protein